MIRFRSFLPPPRPALLAIALSGMACSSHPPAAQSNVLEPAHAATGDPTVAQPAAPRPVPALGPAKPKPELGSYGFDEAGMDKSVAPGASFYLYANGQWLKTNKIPEDKSAYGMFNVLADRSTERTRQIIETASGPPGSNGQRVGDYYKTFMDEATIEALGITPLKAKLEEIAKVEDVQGLVLLLAARSRHLGDSPFQTFMTQDRRDPEHYIPYIGQGGLGLPDRDMYDAKLKQFAAARAGYKKYLAQMFTLLGMTGADQRAAEVYALEAKIAATHWSQTQNRDPQKTYNKMTTAELQKLAPGIDWKPWLEAVGFAGLPVVNVGQPTAISRLAQLVKTQPLAVWRDYLTMQLVSDAVDFLPKKFVDVHFEMFDKTLRGTPQIKERWKRAIEKINDSLGEAVGALYVAKYFTPETKAHADQLVANLLRSMDARLDGLAWMSAETKAKAKAKLASYRAKTGYPKTWRDYSALRIVAGDAVGNGRRTAEFEYNRVLAKFGKPVDRDEWEIPPMEVNAYYNDVRNEIVFSAAILQPPFFDVHADDAVNYGGIGAVIGHEIIHGFDDNGSQYDAKGALKNWWTKEDSDKFKAATGKLVAQYDAYCPIPAVDGKPAQCVKGALTLGENIADLGGLTVAYDAYKRSLGGKPAPVIDGTTGDQRFFLGWAQVWRRLYREQELAVRLVTDPHSPSEFRGAVVRNLDAWYDAFKPAETDALYLAPDKRVKIW